MIVIALIAPIPTVVPAAVMPVVIRGTRPPGATSPGGRTVGVVDRITEIPVDDHRPAIGCLAVVPDTRFVVPLISPVVVCLLGDVRIVDVRDIRRVTAVRITV